jgi:hypothetical protein
VTVTEHLTGNECFSLLIAGLFAPALILGGLVAVAVGLYWGTATENMVAATIMGSAAIGGGCGLLGVLGFYHWHRDLVESQRAAHKMPIEYEEP